MIKPRNVQMFKPHVNTRVAVGKLAAVLASGWIGEGPEVHKFERALQALYGFEHCVALNSCTSALHLALVLARVGPGDQVVTTAQTCTATNMPILMTGAELVFADIQYLTGNVDPRSVADRVTSRTKAIMVVHWAGYPCDMDVISDLALGVPIIADCAHALGATFQGQSIVGWSDYSAFSFQAIKQLTTGDGGLLVVRSKDHYDEARRRRWFGIDREHRKVGSDGVAHWPQTELGFKYHMNDLAAALGLANLEDKDRIKQRRSEIMRCYLEGLADVPGVTLFERKSDRESANWLFTMHVERRDNFHRALLSKGVSTSVVHRRNDIHPIFGGRRQDLPVLDQYEMTNISIPLHSRMTEEDGEYVVQCIEEGW